MRLNFEAADKKTRGCLYFMSVVVVVVVVVLVCCNDERANAFALQGTYPSI